MTLRMFGANAQETGGYFFHRDSVYRFADVAEQIVALGIDEIGVYYPTEAQLDLFERVRTDAVPSLRAR